VSYASRSRQSSQSFSTPPTPTGNQRGSAERSVLNAKQYPLKSPAHAPQQRGIIAEQPPMKASALMQLQERAMLAEQNSPKATVSSPKGRHKSVVMSLSSDPVYIPNKKEQAKMAYLMNENALSKEGKKLLSPVHR